MTDEEITKLRGDAMLAMMGALNAKPRSETERVSANEWRSYICQLVTAKKNDEAEKLVDMAYGICLSRCRPTEPTSYLMEQVRSFRLDLIRACGQRPASPYDNPADTSIYQG